MDRRKHERHVFERRLRKENELEKRRRKNRTFGGVDDGTLDSIETISDDSEEIREMEEAKKREEEEE